MPKAKREIEDDVVFSENDGDVEEEDSKELKDFALLDEDEGDDDVREGTEDAAFDDDF